MTLTLTDLFCGAGGSSTGAIAVPGVEVRVASNHWQLAVDTHNTNHPDADHICADLSQIHPRYFPSSDIMWASPECTNHSRAKGSRPDAGPSLFGETLPDEAAERSRATMWDVVRFAEHHQYRAVLVENVVEATQWAPYRAWLLAMDSLGYDHQIACLNSMHAQRHGLPAPQSRDRFYAAFWRKGNRAPDLAGMQRPEAWCPKCGEIVASIQTWKRSGITVGRYRAQYVYRCPNHACRGQIVEPGWLPALSIINWANRGQRIGDRKRPLAPKTRARIAAGIARYWRPLTIEAAGNTYDAATAGGNHHGLVMRNNTARGDQGQMVTPVTEPIRTITTAGHQSILTPGDLAAAEAQVDDVLFRMLEPDECKRAMAFPDEYVILGNRREQVRMAGNAVTPPAARDLVWTVADALGAA